MLPLFVVFLLKQKIVKPKAASPARVADRARKIVRFVVTVNDKIKKIRDTEAIIEMKIGQRSIDNKMKLILTRLNSERVNI